MADSGSLIISCRCGSCASLCKLSVPGIWLPGQISRRSDIDLTYCMPTFSLVRERNGETHYLFFMALRPAIEAGACVYLGAQGCSLPQIEDCHLPILARRGELVHPTRPIECATARAYDCSTGLPGCSGVDVSTAMAKMLWCSEQGTAVMQRYATVTHTTVEKMARERIRRLADKFCRTDKAFAEDDVLIAQTAKR